MELNLNFLEDEFGIAPGLIIHAGANQCQEKDIYASSKFGPIYWVEAIPKYVDLSRKALAGYANQSVIEATLWSESGLTKQFNISSNDGLSSSLFKMKWHRALQPSISLNQEISVITKTLDQLVTDLNLESTSIQLLVLDLQGAELDVLKGGLKTLQNVQAVHVEVSRVQLYESQPTFREINEFIIPFGFVLAKHDLSDQNYSGDALYVREKYMRSKSKFTVMEDSASIPLIPRNWLKYKLVQLGVPAKFLKRKS